MESRLKKLFHRKKDHSSEQPWDQSHRSAAAASSPTLQTSLYDTARAGGTPQTGSYPIKSNNNSGALPKRKHSLQGHRHEDPTGNLSSLPSTQHEHQGTRGYPPASRSFDTDRQASKPFQPSAQVGAAVYEGHQRRLPEVPPLQDFSVLSLDDTKFSRSPTQPQSSRHGHSTSLGSYREGAIADQINAAARNFNQGTHLQHYRAPHNTSGDPTHALNSDVNHEPIRDAGEAGEPYSIHTASFGSRNDNFLPATTGRHAGNSKEYSSHPKAPSHDPSRSHPQDKSELARKNSIPRKQLRDITKGHASRVQPAFPGAQTQSLADVTNPLQPDRTTYRNDPEQDERKDASSASKVLDRTRPLSRGPGAAINAEHIVDRAKSNTVNTEVTETFAPAVVHETIRQDIHHVREEVITRDIHTHDVHHRILPVIDVEVLPPRHFLPVEGGGLVEISGSEVPGRGQSWVIAETASKIPSDQRAPKAVNRFSAREFVGDEGDSTRYITSEGFEKTEETWVHPPELQTGGRDTGQTWPMGFDEDGADPVASGALASKSSKKGLRKDRL